MSRILLLSLLFYSGNEVAATAPDWSAGTIIPSVRLCILASPGIIHSIQRAKAPFYYSLSYQWRYSYMPPSANNQFSSWAFLTGANGSDCIPGQFSQTVYLVREAHISFCRSSDTLYSNVCFVNIAPVQGHVLAQNGNSGCQGDTMQLIANCPPGSAISWNTGDTSRRVAIASSGFYSFQFVAPFGCSGISDILKVHIGPLYSDFDHNGTVNNNDFIMLNSNFGQLCQQCPQDMNGDGIVDNYDFLIFLSQFNKSCTGNSTNPFPVTVKD